MITKVKINLIWAATEKKFLQKFGEKKDKIMSAVTIYLSIYLIGYYVIVIRHFIVEEKGVLETKLYFFWPMNASGRWCFHCTFQNLNFTFVVDITARTN